MNVLVHWIETPAARALGWTLFHFLWEGIAIAMALASVMLLLRPARLRYLAACLALAAMLVACGGTFLRMLPRERATRTPQSIRVAPPPETGDGLYHARPGLRPEDILPW